MVESDSPQIQIWRMHISYLRHWALRFDIPREQWLRECVSMLLKSTLPAVFKNV